MSKKKVFRTRHCGKKETRGRRKEGTGYADINRGNGIRE